jgi:hypothetical protein
MAAEPLCLPDPAMHGSAVAAYRDPAALHLPFRHPSEGQMPLANL